MALQNILWPMAALAGLTFSVLLIIPFVRLRAVTGGHAQVSDFSLGESARVPGWVSLPNRNYMNLLELPTLFYAVCLALYVTGQVDATAVALAWAYVALRVGHSAIHLTYNHVIHRLVLFASSNLVLAALWIRFGWSLG